MKFCKDCTNYGKGYGKGVSDSCLITTEKSNMVTGERVIVSTDPRQNRLPEGHCKPEALLFSPKGRWFNIVRWFNIQ